MTQRLERGEIVAPHDEITVARLAGGEIGNIFEQMRRNLLVTFRSPSVPRTL
jgi:hypothetical protein